MKFSDLEIGSRFKYCGLICVKVTNASYSIFYSRETSSQQWPIDLDAKVEQR